MIQSLKSSQRLLLLIFAGAILMAAAFASPISVAPAVAAAPAGGSIYKYLIHPGTGGPVACGDSLYPVYVGKRTGDIQRDEAIALQSLFATPKNSGGLYNPLAGSRVKINNIRYNSNKNIGIFLSGKLARPTKFCEIARARAMVWATAQQFPEVKHAIIFFGHVLLGDLLAVKDFSPKK